MASPLETVVLDSAGVSPLTIQSGTVYHLDALDPGLAARRPTWATGVEADGGVLVVDPPYDDAVMTASVQIVPASDTKDAALAALNALTLKLQECSASGPDGLACTYTPANASTTYTFYVKLAEYDGAPPLDPRTVEGYMTLNNQPTVKLKLTRRPFFYAPEIATITDDFSTNTIANYTFDSGPGTLSVSGGQLVPSSNIDKLLYRSVGGYDGAGKYYGVQLTLKQTTGATVGTHWTALRAKRIDASNTLLSTLFDDGSTRTLDIATVDSNVATVLASVPVTGGLAASTSYWHRFRVEGNLLTAELWTSAPTATGSPAFSTTYTLTGAAATKFGLGVGGQVGIRVNSSNTLARYDDFTIEPNVGVSSTPLLTVTLPGVPGDVDAEARLIVTDRANQPRRFVEWGAQQRYYQGLALQIDSGSLVTTNFAGSSVGGLAFGYNANAITATLTATPVVVCSTGQQSHGGAFRVVARMVVTQDDVRVRLSWQESSGRLQANDWATPVASGPAAGTSTPQVEADLGVISISPTNVSQGWLGQIEAFSPSGASIYIDYLLLIPADAGYAKAAFSQPFEAVRTFAARDDFTQSAGALNGKTASVGGTWATSGTGADFAVEATGHTLQRTSVSDGNNTKQALLGSTSFAATLLQYDFMLSATDPLFAFGSRVRYVDASNFMQIAFYFSDPTYPLLIQATCTVAGVTVNPQPSVKLRTPLVLNRWYTTRLVIDPGGSFTMWLFQTGQQPERVFDGSHPSLATGGALASGKVGLADDNDSAVAITRSFDNFIAAVPLVDEVVFPGRQMEFRPDGAIRQDGAGAWGPFTNRGGNFMVPAAGAEGRPARVAVRGRRNNPEEVAVLNVTDKLQAQVALTPRYLHPK
jgi:hypothetical protein